MSTSAPAATSLVIAPRPPRTRQSRDSYVITHMEYLADIAGSTTPFSVVPLSINPGLPTFPWLSPIAAAYELYKFRSLAFIYAGRTSSATGGYCTMAMDYDPTDPNPSSKLEVNNYDDRIAVVPWCEKAVLNCKHSGFNRLKTFMTRGTSIADELGLYDIGTLFIVTGNQATAGSIGELWVEYSIEFTQPQVNRAGPLVARSNASFNYLADTNYTTGFFTVPFSNTVYNPYGFNDVGGVISGVAGVFTIYAQVQYSAATAPSTFQLLIAKNGVSIQTVISPGATVGTVNVQCIASLVASDTISIQVAATGGATIKLVTGVPAGSANTLQITPA